MNSKLPLPLRSGSRINSAPGDRGREPLSSNSLPPLISIEDLRRENQSLRQELKETKTLLKQLLTEQQRESYEGRRVNLLKAQLFQTERQLLLLQRGMTKRSATLWEAENTLNALKSQCQTLATTDAPSSHVSVPRAQLFRLTEGVEKARSSLFRHLERDLELDRREIIVPQEYCAQDGLSVLDLLVGKEPMYNLKKVSALESQVAACYSTVTALATRLSVFPSISNRKSSTVVPVLASDHEFESLRNDTETTKKILKDLGTELLSLSFLVPLSEQSQPSPSIPRSLDAEVFLSQLPRKAVVKSRWSEVSSIARAFVNARDVERGALETRLRLAEEELSRFTELFQVQDRFVYDVFEHFETEYDGFQAALNRSFEEPLGALLRAFGSLKQDPSEEALRTFLLNLTAHEEALHKAQKLLVPSQESRAFHDLRSIYGNEVQKSLNQILGARETRLAELKASETDGTCSANA